MSKKIFITGISTEVGKTIVAAIVVEALKADYWKPIQSGDLKYSDTDKLKALVSNSKTIYHPNSYALNTPMSPHESARLDGLTIQLSEINLPDTKNNIVVEGAGGLLVPLNNENTILDLLDSSYKVIVVSRHYLGSINHTLMTLELLKQKGVELFIVFSGDAHKSTEAVIQKMSGVRVLGRVNNEPYFDKNVIKEYADLFKEKLVAL